MSVAHPVAQLLYQRRKEGSVPGARTDGYRIGLVVEGGGMRGLLSGAMMATLLDHELEQSFDAIYASSAGALNSVYFLSGLSWHALSIYYDHLACRDFVDLSRLLSGQPVLSLAYALDEVVETTRPLDYDAVLASPISLNIVTSSLQTLQPRVFNRFTSKENLKLILRATCCVPFAAGAPIPYNDDLLLDGGVLLAHPILPALDDHCTHILALRTWGQTSFPMVTFIGRKMMAGYLQHLRFGLGTAYLNTIKRSRYLHIQFQEQSQCLDTPPFLLEVACPIGTHQITRFTRDQGVLFQGLRAGYEAMLKALGDDYASQHTYLRPTTFSPSSATFLRR